MTEKENVNVTKNLNVKETENKIYIEREKFTSNGKEYYNYILKGKVRDKDVKVDFAPKDKGGYEVLDLVFDTNSKAELIVSEESMTDSAGKTMKYAVYTAQTIDEDGIVYACNVKPARDSDKALLGMILSKLAIKK